MQVLQSRTSRRRCASSTCRPAVEYVRSGKKLAHHPVSCSSWSEVPGFSHILWMDEVLHHSETIVCWHAQGNHPSRVSVRNGFRPSTVLWADGPVNWGCCPFLREGSPTKIDYRKKNIGHPYSNLFTGRSSKSQNHVPFARARAQSLRLASSFLSCRCARASA